MAHPCQAPDSTDARCRGLSHGRDLPRGREGSEANLHVSPPPRPPVGSWITRYITGETAAHFPRPAQICLVAYDQLPNLP